MATGTIRWFSDEKGFGFITPDESGKDVFVRRTVLDAGVVEPVAGASSPPAGEIGIVSEWRTPGARAEDG